MNLDFDATPQCQDSFLKMKFLLSSHTSLIFFKNIFTKITSPFAYAIQQTIHRFLFLSLPLSITPADLLFSRCSKLEAIAVQFSQFVGIHFVSSTSHRVRGSYVYNSRNYSFWSRRLSWQRSRRCGHLELEYTIYRQERKGLKIAEIRSSARPPKEMARICRQIFNHIS